jgi:hypothetical protein
MAKRRRVDVPERKAAVVPSQPEAIVRSTKPLAACACAHALLTQAQCFAAIEGHLRRNAEPSQELRDLLAQVQSFGSHVVSSLPRPAGARSRLNGLSTPLKCLIIQFLNPEEHIRCRLVSRAMHAAASSPHAWPVRMVLLEVPLVEEKYAPAYEDRKAGARIVAGGREGRRQCEDCNRPPPTFQQRLAAELQVAVSRSIAVWLACLCALRMFTVRHIG